MMNTMNVIIQLVQRMGGACFFVAAVILMGCSSAPESQPEPSKKEVQQDADRFFNKMRKEEAAPSSPQK